MEKSDQSRSDHGQCMHAHQAWFTDWAQALSILLTTSSCSPAADSAQQTCGWIWKVLSVSVYFLFQTLESSLLLSLQTFTAPVRKNIHINRFYFQRKYDIITQCTRSEDSDGEGPALSLLEQDSGSERRTQVRVGRGCNGQV